MPDLRITELPTIPAIAAGDVLPIVGDPTGVPVTCKATVAQLAAAIGAILYPVGRTIEFDGDANVAYPWGTWVEVGAGRVPVGLDTGDADFDTIGKTGGAKAVTLTEAQLPAHSHGVTDPGHAHVENSNNATTGSLRGWGAPDTSTNSSTATGYSTANSQAGITIDAAGGGQAHSNLPPVHCYFSFALFTA